MQWKPNGKKTCGGGWRGTGRSRCWTGDLIVGLLDKKLAVVVAKAAMVEIEMKWWVSQVFSFGI